MASEIIESDQLVEQGVVMADAQSQDESPSGSEADSDDGSEEEVEENQTFLATTRERRANAGNRMSRLLEAAGAEDIALEEYADIFQEQANDEEFQELDEDDDLSLSSSDEEDSDAAQAEDHGEQELQKQERQENKKKRKQETLIQQMMKRKVAKASSTSSPTQASSMASPSTLPKRKADRIPWIPFGDEEGVRSSSRKSAIKNKEATRERLQAMKKQREKTVANMKAAEQRKEANRPKVLTQEDRLAEAARIERQNSKTVNRWEAAEALKAEEQRARLAALKNKRLDGPVIGYYSGPALWINDKLRVVGKRALVQDLSLEDEEGKVGEVAEEPQGANTPVDSSVSQQTPRADNSVADTAITPQSEVVDSSLPTEQSTQDHMAPAKSIDTQMVDGASVTLPIEGNAGKTSPGEIPDDITLGTSDVGKQEALQQAKPDIDLPSIRSSLATESLQDVSTQDNVKDTTVEHTTDAKPQVDVINNSETVPPVKADFWDDVQFYANQETQISPNNKKTTPLAFDSSNMPHSAAQDVSMEHSLITAEDV